MMQCKLPLSEPLWGNNDTIYSYRHIARLIFHQFWTIIFIGGGILFKINEVKKSFVGLGADEYIDRASLLGTTSNSKSTLIHHS